MKIVPLSNTQNQNSQNFKAFRVENNDLFPYIMGLTKLREAPGHPGVYLTINDLSDLARAKAGELDSMIAEKAKNATLVTKALVAKVRSIDYVEAARKRLEDAKEAALKELNII